MRRYSDRLLAEAEQELQDARERIESCREAVEVWRAALAQERANQGLEPADEPEASLQLSDASMIEGAVEVLRQRGEAMGAEEIEAAVREAGWQTSSKNPLNVVRTGLYRETEKEEPRIIKTAPGTFGLPAWSSEHGEADDSE